MPLYSELSYYLPNNSVYSANRCPLSSSPYSPFSRLNPYTPPPPRPTIYSKDGQFKPMLTSISESPSSSLRTNGLTSLTRMNSGKTYNFLRSPGSYVSPRPIHINTADIDVSATRFHRHRNHRVRSTSPEPAQKQANDKESTNETTDSSAFMPRVDQNDPVQSRATIKRDRNIVRLSTMRQRSQSHSNRSSQNSTKTDKMSKISSPKSSIHDNSSFKKSLSQESDEIATDTKTTVKKSWRDKFGDSLQINTPKVVRKTPGELILERHIIREKNNSLKVPLEPTPTPTIVRIPDNVTQQEITYLEPLIRKSIRRQSLITCPSFKDICKDISSDIKDEDDLNAGDLRRRASLILEQEAQIIAQLTSIRRPSADVTVDEAIAEEPASDEKDPESQKDDVEIPDEKSADKPKSENVIIIKKKTKKKGGKLKHKITVSVEVDNSVTQPLTLNVNTDPDPVSGNASDTTNANANANANACGSGSGSSSVGAGAGTGAGVGVSGTKTSPTWRAVVEEIKEDITLNLPKKSQKGTHYPLNKCETEEDFWNLIGRRESIYFKKKVDLKRNEIEIIEILDNDEKQVADNDDVNEMIEIKSNASPQIKNHGMNVETTIATPTTPTTNITSTPKTKTTTLNGKQPKDINIKANENRQENVGNKMLPKKNVKNDNKSVDGVKTIASIETRPAKCENALSNKETVAKPMEIKPMENSGSVEKTAAAISSASPIFVENVTTVSNETPCHKHKQTTKCDVKAPTMMQTVDLNLETGPQANKATKTTKTTKTEQLEKPTATATATSTPASTSTSTSTSTTKQKQIVSTVSTPESPTKADSDKGVSANDSNELVKPEVSSDKKLKVKKVIKKVAGDKSSETETKPKPKKKVIKKAAAERKIAKIKSISSIESEINAESTDADTSAASESIALTETIDTKLSDRGNDNESELNLAAGANQTSVAKPFDNYEYASSGGGDGGGDGSNGVGGLSKFATVANLNADFEFECKSPSIDLVNDRQCNEKSTFSTRSIADSCISGDEQIDLLVDFLSSDSDKYSDSESEDEMGQKRRHKKRKEKLDTRKVMKLDPKRKCYITDEVSKYPMIATPRPLAKRSNYCKNYAESESESETSSDICSSDECYDECLSPNDIVVKDVIRMSTCSNDSGFEGGGTAPSSPKKMLETSYTYAQFQRSGTITAPATSIPRFKKYSVDDFHFLTVLGKGSFGKVLLAELKNTEYYYAVKCLKKDVVLEDDDVECTLIERKVLALGTKHPYLCHLFCTFQTESHLFFVMEYLNGGDLMFHIQVSGRFPEPRAKFYAAEIISGLKFLHKKGIIYRDLKLDNILLDFDGHVRIADFGMCKLQIYLDRTADSFCGTPDYMAPEIIKGQKYNQHVDWWSFGVLLYEMLIGQSPFSGCDEDELFWSICNEIPWYPFYLSKEALNILSKLLEKDANVRLGAGTSPHGEITENVFFYEIDWKKLERRQLEPPFKPKIKHPLDTQYFDKTFTRERVRLTPIDKDILQSIDQHQFQGFTYTNPNTTPP